MLANDISLDIRFISLKENLGILLCDVLYDYDRTKSFTNIKYKYCSRLCNMIEYHLKYISEITAFYHWLEMSTTWMYKTPFAMSYTMDSFMINYRKREQAFAILHKILSDINNRKDGILNPN